MGERIQVVGMIVLLVVLAVIGAALTPTEARRGGAKVLVAHALVLKRLPTLPVDEAGLCEDGSIVNHKHWLWLCYRGVWQRVHSVARQ